MSFEELASLIGKVAERTREEGSSIGNALKTIIVRLSKASSLSGADEVDTNTLSDASKALHDVGVEVYNLDGSFRPLMTIMGELSAKWDDLSDAQQANISYAVAATRQTNKFRTIIESFAGTMELATSATNTFGNAEANQAKYAASIQGVLQSISTEVQAMWLNFMNSDFVYDGLDLVNQLVKALSQALSKGGASSAIALAAGTFGLNLGANIGKAAIKELASTVSKGLPLALNMARSGDLFRIGQASRWVANTARDNPTAIDDIAQALGGLNVDQRRMAVKTSGIDQGLATQVLASADSLNVQTMDVGTVKSLSNAYSGLAAALGVSTKALSAFLGVAAGVAIIGTGIALYQDYKRKLEEARQAATDFGNELKVLGKDENEAKKQIIELRKITDSYWSSNAEQREAKNQLLDLQERLNETYGDEAKKLDLVTGSVKGQIDALNELEKAKWKAWGREETNGHRNADLGEEASNVMSSPYTGYERGYLNPTTPETPAEDLKSVFDEFEAAAKDVGLTLVADTSAEEGQAGLLGYNIASALTPQQTKTALTSLLTTVETQLGAMSADDPLRDYYEVFFERLSMMLDEVNEVIDQNQDLAENYLLYSLSHLGGDRAEVKGYENTPLDLYYDYEKAISEYQTALRSGEEDAIEETEKRYKQLAAYVTAFLGNSENAMYSSLFNQSNQELQSTVVYKKRAYLEGFNASQYSQLSQSGYSDQDLLAYARGATDMVSPEDKAQVDQLLQSLTDVDLELSDVIDDFTRLGVVTKEVGAPEVEKIDFSQTIKSVSVLQDSLSAVTGLYKQVADDESFVGMSSKDLDTIQESFSSVFGTDIMDQWLNKLRQAGSDAESVKKTLLDMMTSWITAQDSFKKAADNRDLEELVYLFESMGIAVGALNEEQELSVEQQAKQAGSSKELARNISSIAAALGIEADAVGATSTAYNALYVQKLATAGTIDFISGDLDQLNTIMQGLGLGRQAWVDYYNARANIDKITSIVAAGDEAERVDKARARSVLGAVGWKGMDLEEGLKWYNEEYLPQQEQLLLNDLQKLSETNPVSVNPEILSPNSSSSSGSDSTADPEAIDWQERRIKYLEKEHNLLTSIYEDEKALYTSRRQALSDAIGWDKEQIQAYTESKNNWYKLYEQGLNGILGLTDTEGKNPITREMIEGIQSGMVEFNAGKYSKDSYDAIKEVLDYYDSYLEADEKILDLEDEISEHQTAMYESQIQQLEQVLSLKQSEASILSSKQSLAEATGQLITEDFYKKQIRNSKSQISTYYDQIDVYEEYLDELEEGSEEYANIESRIAQCRSAIAEAKVQQAEWNDEIKRIPIKRIDSYLSSLSHIKSLMTNLQNEYEAAGKTLSADQMQTFINLDSEEIEASVAQLKEYQKLIGDYEWGSTKYEETASSIQQIKDNISSIVVDMTNWNKQILNLPIDKLTEANEKLSTSIEALTEQEEEYNSVIDGVTSSIDERIDAINKEREATEKYYEEQIEAIQDVIDALEEENELRDKRLAVEQAEYNLNKAQNQRNVAVIGDNGGVQYIADEDAVRDAQDALDEAKYNYKIYLLQKQIEDLEEERDELLEQYDDQIEALEDISEKWEKITSNIQLAKDSLTALNYLGEGWLEKVLSGNDQAIFDKFVAEYKSNDDMLTAAQKMQESNNRISTLLQSYVDDYMAGKISYEEAFANIKTISSYVSTGLGVSDNLQETLNYLKGTDFTNFLKTLSESTQQEANRYEEYLKAVKNNSSYMQNYQLKLDGVNTAIENSIAALKASYEAATKQTIATNTLTNTIARAADVPVVKSGSASLGDEYVHHSGINTGYIGAGTSDQKLEALKAMTLTPLKPDEMPALLQAGEIVLNRSQQDTLLSNIRKLSSVSPIVAAAKSGTVVNMTLSNLTFHEIQNGQDFANYITKNLSSAIAQSI